VVEAWFRVHLYLQEHHRELQAAGFGAARGLPGPEHTIEEVAQLFDFERFKAVDAISDAAGRWPARWRQRLSQTAERGSVRVRSGRRGSVSDRRSQMRALAGEKVAQGGDGAADHEGVAACRASLAGGG
jgi:hypothetical protein